jgi:hypothetical protein
VFFAALYGQYILIFDQTSLDDSWVIEDQQHIPQMAGMVNSQPLRDVFVKTIKQRKVKPLIAINIEFSQLYLDKPKYTFLLAHKSHSH